jgi:hypothetical protein
LQVQVLPGAPKKVLDKATTMLYNGMEKL